MTTDSNISRRDFTTRFLGGLLSTSLLITLGEAQAVKGPIKPKLHKWVFDLQDASRALRKGEVKNTEWQDRIDEILTNVELPDLLKAIDYDRLAKTTTLYADHETAEDISFNRIRGLTKDLAFAPYFYGMKKGVSIVPHGHRNMCTMHMMLKGEAHGRHFDRVADEPNFMTVRPTRDKTIGPGGVTTISPDRDNIHWFTSLSEPVFMFNIGIYGLDPKAATTGRDYIDPAGGEKLGDGSLRVPRIDGKAAYKLYGAPTA